MSIICIGQCVYDITFPMEGSLVENQKYRIYNKRECMGGPAGNAAYVCGLYNQPTTLIARIGDDLFGHEIIKTLQSVNVDTDYLSVQKELNTSVSCIIVNESNGHRTILNAPLKQVETPLQLPYQEPKVILMDGREYRTSLKAIQQYPKALSILDGGTYREELLPLIKEIDYCVISEDFAKQYTKMAIDLNHPRPLFDKLSEINKNVIIVTLGHLGSLLYKDNEIKHIKAYQADVLDTTGAGDIFHGMFAYGIHKEIPLVDTIKCASLCASLSVERYGGQTSVPTLVELKERATEVAPELVQYL